MNRRRLLRLAAGSLALTAQAPRFAGAQAQRATPRSAVASSLQDAVNVRAFGATGDGVADDTRAIQRALDHALQNRIPAVRLPAGRYRTTDTLHLGYGQAFTTLALLGEGAPSFAGDTAGAVILPGRWDRPALNIQGARMSAVRNIALKGLNFDHVAGKIRGHAGTADPRPEGWLDAKLAGGLNRFAPYAAITIDAYAAPPRAGAYPAPPAPPWPTPWSVPAARNFSSDVEIERCWIGGFAVGIAVQPCDADGNGDFVRISGSTLQNCVYAVAVGNSQSRNVALRDCTYAGVHTFVSNKAVGRGIGTLGGPIDNVSGGASYQFMDIVAARSGPVVITSLYFEAQCRIGAWSTNAAFNNTLTFQSCQFDLNERLIRASTSSLVDCGARGAVRFSGCTFNGARRIFHPVRGASFVGIDSCMFVTGQDYRGADFYENVPPHIATALNYTCGGVFLHADAARGACELTGGNLGIVFDPARPQADTQTWSKTLVVPPGRRVAVHHYATDLIDRFGRQWLIRARRQPAPFDKVIGHGPLRAIAYAAPDEIQLELDARIQSNAQTRIESGDVLYDTPTATVFAVAGITSDAKSCRVTATQLNNLRSVADEVHSAVDVTGSGGYLWLYHASQMVGDTVFFGDFTAGSPLVRNVHAGDGGARGLARCLLPGDLLHHDAAGPPLPGTDRPQPYGAMTMIASVAENAGTVTLDRPATATARFALSTVALG